jgi:hypothetical protein
LAHSSPPESGVAWGDRAMFAFVVDKPDVAKSILERKG